MRFRSIPVGMGRARYQATTPTDAPHSRARIAISSRTRFLGFTPAVSHSHGDWRCFGLTRFFPQPDIRLKLAHHLAEAGQCEGLCPVADCLFRARVNFED